MHDMRYKKRSLIFLLWLALLGVGACQFASQSSSASVGITIPGDEIAEPNVVKSPMPELAEPDSVGFPELKSVSPDVSEAIYELIYRGEFDEAGELIESNRPHFSQLGEIVAEYQEITRRRQETREARYKEQLEELEKFHAPEGTNDFNDVNDISEVLSVIAKTSGFANESQKAELLSDPFVERTFRKAIEKAGELESEGKWLDSYVMCYSWLQAIDKENKAYSEYAENLIEKANIAASFQDSPCESREERYEGVDKKMFIRSIDSLRFNYVSGLIDYRQMAIKAVRHCELLAEVVNSSPIARRSLTESQIANSQKQFSAWSEGLNEFLNQINRSPMNVSRDKFIDVFERVLALNTKTVDLPSSLLIVHFAESALSTLDPYTVIVWPKQAGDFEKIMTNEFTGIGIEISKEKGLLTVVSLLPGTPAYNSGLDADDVIEKVDGVETKDMSLSCAVKNITGPAGTDVKLTIRSPHEDKSRDITITRARIIVPTIRGWQRTEGGEWLYMIDDQRKIGYIRITNFSEKTASDFETALDGLEAEGLKGLILDLRFNSGGLLSSAIEITDKFVEEGPIVVTRPRSWVSSTHAIAHKEGTHPNYPLVVLINSYSASASEIVAGALADPLHERAILVGDRTHGKGSVQGIISYPKGGAQLKYTMAYYHLPSGQRVKSQEEVKELGRDDWGVGPDVEVKLRNDEIRDMSDIQRDNDVLVSANHNKESATSKKHTTEESLSSDPQLAVGLLIIRTKLIQSGSGT